MSSNAQPDRMATLVAEEILRRIFGDDLQGCPVTLDEIALIVHQAAQQQNAQNQLLLDTYAQLVEAIHLLSTPPDASQVIDPANLRSLLTERLDAIHAVTTKTRNTTALLKKQRGDSTAS
jgi:hypothetical protein